MDIADFNGISYFRFLVPSIYIILWTAIPLGIYFVPQTWRVCTLMVFIYMLCKAVYQLILSVGLVVRGNAVIKKVLSPPEKSQNVPLGQVSHQIFHAFAIPSYKQDIELLADTLQTLASHKRAQYSYLIFLAMEQHEQGSDKKAEQLIERFKSNFRFIDYTQHKIRQFEQKGKASNVSWCVEHMSEKFKQQMINQQDVFVTVIDADSWAPNVYFDQVQDHLFKNFDNRYEFIYQPTQIFTRNNMEVPILVRGYDDVFSSLHAANQISCSNGFTFSFSNYSLSYSLVKKIGFWDTVEQAIAQDFHMCVKSYFKTNGNVKTIPIFAPFNQLNIQTGNGSIQDIKAKFWQLQRHSRAVAEIGYSILMLVRSEFSIKSIFLVFTVIEMILLPIIIPWPVIALFVQDQVVHAQGATSELLSTANFMLLFNIANASAFLSSLLYEYYKRRCSKIIYGIQNPSLLHSLEAALLYGFYMVFVISTTYIMGAFGGLKKNRQYKVADKNCSAENKSQTSTQQFLNIKEQQKSQLLPTQNSIETTN